MSDGLSSQRYGTIQPCSAGSKRGPDDPPNALTLAPRKRPNLQTDPLVHHGRHFGRSIYAFANVHALLIAGIAADEDIPAETKQQRREYRVYKKLLNLVPDLEEKIMQSDSEEGLMSIASMKGAASARSDDTKSLKGAIVDWIVPADGQPLRPPISRGAKGQRGFHHDRTGFLLCPAELDWTDDNIKKQLQNKELTITGSHWPIFLYQNELYNPEDPWQGLLRSKLLLTGFKHIFTSPSSVDSEPKATRSGNARIHGMTRVTPASLAYVATQIRFALSSASVFSRMDSETDSETFYTSILELLEDPEEQDEVKELLSWWNQ